MAAAVLLKISILMVTFLMVNCNQYELCGQVVKSVQNRFAIDGDGARIVAPWIVALGVKKDEDKDGFDEFNVKCTGSILTDNVVIREAHLHKHIENIFVHLYHPNSHLHMIKCIDIYLPSQFFSLIIDGASY